MAVQKMAEPDGRVETGVVQFGDDSPGLFIRGDGDAVSYAQDLQLALQHPDKTKANKLMEPLLNLLFECHQAYLNHEKSRHPSGR